MEATLENTVFSFEILEFLTYPKVQTYTNVVFNIKWRYTGDCTDINGKGWMYYIIGSTELNTNKLSNFIPYEELTLEITTKWITENNDISSLQKTILDKLTSYMNPPEPEFVSLPPPF